MPQDRFQPGDTVRHQAYRFAATCCAMLHFGLVLPGRVILAELFKVCIVAFFPLAMFRSNIILLSRQYYSMIFHVIPLVFQRFDAIPSPFCKARTLVALEVRRVDTVLASNVNKKSMVSTTDLKKRHAAPVALSACKSLHI